MKIPSKVDLVMYGLMALAAAGLLAVVAKWKHDAGLLKVERREHSAEIRKKNDEIDAKQRELETERRNAQLARDASNDYQQQLEDLRAARAATPTRSVRLCRAAPELPAAAGGSGAPGPEGVSEAPRSSIEIGRDIGPELYALADEADQCAAQRDGLINWLRSTSARP